MSNHENYLAVEIHIVPADPEARGRVRAALLDHGVEDDDGLLPDVPVGVFSRYFGDSDAPASLAHALAAVPDTSFRLWTEEAQGEPGSLIAHVAGIGTFDGRCDRSGAVVVTEADAARLAAEPAAAERLRPLEEMTGSTLRSALADSARGA
ncbi:DUF3145 family protein [Kitasatospora sp. NPDC092948]|uniref:DUF3145 family protein n=1 Tax=Kitasatospora sp. NPDC092948 TaxID=3364088 RepID=UPI00381EF459